MSNYRAGAPAGKKKKESKCSTLGSVNRQHVMQETNKRRSLLQDNSWIKRRPEEEEVEEKMKDENYGKSILNRYKSQENLDRSNEEQGPKIIHNRFKSDDALDRISSKSTSEGGNQLASLERKPVSGKSEYDSKRQSWTPGSRTTTTTTSTTTTTEDKRKSWTPTSRSIVTTTETTHTIQSSDKPTTTNWFDSAKSRFEKSEQKLPPSPSSSLVKNDSRNTDELDSLSEMKSSPVKENNRTDELNNLIDIKPTTLKGKSRADDIGNFIDIKPTALQGKSRDPAVTRTYENSIAANSIKTVYSTSDRSVIEKDMCTYCRKSLGIDAKMILKDLNICCHATCFKCEVCQGNLGGLKAGDSMWIYRQSIHCEPCYFTARDKWII
ncbi:hypothetical protein GDO86_004143 [Hymenochirus boettgeri]|uniref:LIM zinc-binding domain-containing protein n=1 Tax=Hymenochirus boettgeri TaxID=247094 RepID=A0A8T2K9B6_9PIPI|nr:hypothetical protein GDO86_004143 [Hymenochirus boettgeri]